MGYRKERREHVRYDMHFPVSVTYPVEQGGQTEETHTINISVGGVYLPLQRRVSVGGVVEMGIRTNKLSAILPRSEVSDNALIMTGARVVRVEEEAAYPCNICAGFSFEGPLRIIASPESGVVQKKQGGESSY